MINVFRPYCSVDNIDNIPVYRHRYRPRFTVLLIVFILVILFCFLQLNFEVPSFILSDNIRSHTMCGFPFCFRKFLHNRILVESQVARVVGVGEVLEIFLRLKRLAVMTIIIV